MSESGSAARRGVSCLADLSDEHTMIRDMAKQVLLHSSPSSSLHLPRRRFPPDCLSLPSHQILSEHLHTAPTLLRFTLCGKTGNDGSRYPGRDRGSAVCEQQLSAS